MCRLILVCRCVPICGNVCRVTARELLRAPLGKSACVLACCRYPSSNHCRHNYHLLILLQARTFLTRVCQGFFGAILSPKNTIVGSSIEVSQASQEICSHRKVRRRRKEGKVRALPHSSDVENWSLYFKTLNTIKQ